MRASAAIAAGWSIFCTVSASASVKTGHVAVAFARAIAIATLRVSRVVAAFVIIAGWAGARQIAGGVLRSRVWALRLRGNQLPVNLRGRLRPDRSWAHPFALLSTRLQAPDWLRAPAWSKSSRWRHPFADARLVSPAELLQKPDWVRKPAWLRASAQREQTTWSSRLKWSITPEWLSKPAWLAIPTWSRKPAWLRRPAWLVAPGWLRKPAWLRAVDLRRNIIGPAIVAMMVIVAAVFTAVVYSSPRSGASPGPLVSPVVDESSDGDGPTTYLSAAPVERSTAPDGQVVIVPAPSSTAGNSTHNSTTTKKSAAPSAKVTSVTLPITYPIYVFPVTSPTSATPTFIFVQPTSPTTHLPAPGTTSATKTSTAPTTPVITTPVKTTADPPPATTTAPVKTTEDPPPVTSAPVSTVVPPPATTTEPAPPPATTSVPAPPLTTTATPDPITILLGDLFG